MIAGCVTEPIRYTAAVTISDVRPNSGWLGRYRIVAWTALVLLAAQLILRCLLLLRFADTTAPGDVVRAMLAGLRFDLLVTGIVVLPQVLHMTLQGDERVRGRLSRVLIHVGLVVSFAVLLFVMASEYLFFEEFSSRLNYIAFEYLVYPTEVATNIWESFPVVPILLAVTMVAVAIYWPMRPMIRRALAVDVPARRRWSVLAIWLAGIVLLWTTTTRATMKVGEDRVVNEIAGNGLWTFVENAWTSRFDYDAFYPTLPAAEAEAIAAAEVFRPGEVPAANPVNVLDRIVDPGRPANAYNVIVVLEESLGSDFIGVLGDDRGLTPNLDRLSDDALLFDNFYATGNRTARRSKP